MFRYCIDTEDSGYEGCEQGPGVQLQGHHQGLGWQPGARYQGHSWTNRLNC